MHEQSGIGGVMEKFKNKCSCGKYETLFDMAKGAAISAAREHVMLAGEHKVQTIGWGKNGIPYVEFTVLSYGSEPHQVSQDGPTDENDPMGRFHPLGKEGPSA